MSATLLWGLSFPLIRAMWLAQSARVPELGSVCFASTAAVVRFSIGAIVVALFCSRTLRTITRSEVWQGAGLAFFGGLGIVFQMDGLAHTQASISAFLTQFYCLLIPLWAAWRQRMAPRMAVIISSAMVLAGVAILADVHWSDFRIGRGEAETLIAAVFFAGQILWLERPVFANNRVRNFTTVMFAGMALLLAPIAVFTAPSARAVIHAYASLDIAIIVGAIVVFCTLGAYLVMNRWQRYVTATEAGLIYCVEPVAAAAFALFLPGWLSMLSDVEYTNERITWRLLVGGALITLANVMVQLEAMRRKGSDSIDAVT